MKKPHRLTAAEKKIIAYCRSVVKRHKEAMHMHTNEIRRECAQARIDAFNQVASVIRKGL